MLVYTATHVLPVASRPVRDGAVAIEDGRIVAVGTRQAVRDEVGADVEIRDLGHAAVLPGLINAHCHLELSWLEQDRPPGGDYVGWVGGLLDRRTAEDPQRRAVAAAGAIDRMVARGTVAVGDVANREWIAPVLAASPLHGILFHEIYGPRVADAESLLRQGVRVAQTMEHDLRAASDRLRVMLTPHAPHTTSEPLLRALAGRATASGEPVTIHVAESRSEVELLGQGTGSLHDLLRERRLLEENWRAPSLTPIEHLDRVGLLTPRTLAVHCVHLLQRDVSKLQARGVSVVTCPRSNAYLGVGRAPVPQLLGLGIPVALGTDSLASAPDVDLFAEMSALCREHSQLAPAAVLRMATLNGAAALDLADRLGSIERDKLARLLVVPLAPGEDDAPAKLCNDPAEVYALDAAPYTRAEA